MKVLYYTNSRVEDSVVEAVIAKSCEVVRFTEKLQPEMFEIQNFDMLVSDRAEYIVPKAVLDLFENWAINCHSSFLPYNRGGLNILWATVMGVPYGNSIHKMVEKFDEGDIIVQSAFALNPKYTLREAYKLVRLNMEALFHSAWESGLIVDSLENGEFLLSNKSEEGSSQSVSECRRAKSRLPKGWDTTLQYLIDHKSDFLALLENKE